MIDEERKKEQMRDSGEINKENSKSMEFSVNGLPEEIDEEAEALRSDELKIEEASNFDEEAEALGIKE